MRHTPNLKLDRYRCTRPGLDMPVEAGTNWGYFEIDTAKGKLRVLSSDGKFGAPAGAPEHGWEHVSVSLAGRAPTWREMCLVKDLFWADDEVVVQYHPAKSSYVNVHEHVLHLWRHVSQRFPEPPHILVGPNCPADEAQLAQEIAAGRYPDIGRRADNKPPN